ncbi:hypothetical protein Bca4012_065810 [Brassica carinata]
MISLLTPARTAREGRTGAGGGPSPLPSSVFPLLHRGWLTLSALSVSLYLVVLLLSSLLARSPDGGVDSASLWLSGGGCGLVCLVLGVLEGCVLQAITGSALEVLSSSKVCLYCRRWRVSVLTVQARRVLCPLRCRRGRLWLHRGGGAFSRSLLLLFRLNSRFTFEAFRKVSFVLAHVPINCFVVSVCHRINSSSFPSVTPIGVFAHPSAVGVSLELHSSVVSLTLLAGLGALSGFRAAVISDPSFVGVFVAVRNLRFVSSLLYPELHRLQSFGKDESWMLLAPTRINLGEVVMTKGSGLRPQLAVCPNS